MMFWILFIAIFVIIYIKWKHSYWRNKGVPQFDPNLLIGDTKLDRTFGEHFQTVYQQLKTQKQKHGGVYFFLRPVYVPVDNDIIKAILLHNSDCFIDRSLFVLNKESDPLSANLFNLDGEEWKPLRHKLSPAFTSTKIKRMLGNLLNCTRHLNDILDEYSLSSDLVDIKEVFSRFTIDVICSCAFGFECNALKDPNSEFPKYLQTVFQSSFVRRLSIVASQILPKEFLTLFNIKFVSGDVEKFFFAFVKKVVDDREKSEAYRQDFMHLLLHTRNRGENEDNQSMLDMNEITAQCFAFFVAGFESTATTMTFALYELSLHQDMQEKLREEILCVLSSHDNKYSYEAVMDMDYLNRIIQESLRKYPPAGGIDRRSNKTFKIPGTDIILDKGTHVHIPAYAIHMDPDYYHDPEVFDPDRFTVESKAKRPACTWLPFGDGPRNCIGMRFAMFECKVAIATIICKNRVTLSSRTRFPLVMDPGSPITTAKGKIWLSISKLE